MSASRVSSKGKVEREKGKFLLFNIASYNYSMIARGEAKTGRSPGSCVKYDGVIKNN